jgi:hypothetical protein
MQSFNRKIEVAPDLNERTIINWGSAKWLAYREVEWFLVVNDRDQ